MSKKYKKPIIIGIVILAIVLIISALSNSTYALFSTDDYGSNTNVYSTGMLSIEAKSKTENISLTDALPMTDEDGVNTSPYVFTITNVGNLDYLFDVKLLSVGSSDTVFSPQYIKIQIDNGDVTTLSALSNGVIKSNITLLAGESIDISIRLWLSIDTPNSQIGRVFNSKIVTDGQAIYTESNKEYTTTFIKHLSNLYYNSKPTTVNDSTLNTTYYYSYLNSGKTWGLMSDNYDNKGNSVNNNYGGNIRYFGSNPDNYIYFNCNDYSDTSTCEVWRIVGIIDGKIKIVRSSSLGSVAWDYDYNDGNGSTSYSYIWDNASINTLLNDAYYNNSDEDVVYYSKNNVSTTFNFANNNIGIKNDATRDLIAESLWHTYSGQVNTIYPNAMYKLERTDRNNWTGNIALLNVSDYGYASDLNKCKQILSAYNNSNCYNTNWIYPLITSNGSDYGWLINAVNYPWIVAAPTYGVSYTANAHDTNQVVPSLYLDSDVVIKGGAGTEGSPYQIYVETPIKLIEYIKNEYTSNNPTLITQEVSNDSYYYSYQDAGKTWGLMNDGLKVSSTEGIGTTIITDEEILVSGSEGNIRYFGPGDKVNNYIYFNCNNYSIQSLKDTNGNKNCELWRIIGIVDGKVKIINSESIGFLSWDDDHNNADPTATYSNNWEFSSLQLFLNGLYYDRGTKTSHIYYNNNDGVTKTELNLNEIGITEATRTNGLISISSWYLGGNISFEIFPDEIYSSERSSVVDTNINSGYPFKIEAGIGLMYPSDYGYATNFSKCNSNLWNYSSSVCAQNNWLHFGKANYLITPAFSSMGSAGLIHGDGKANSASYVWHLADIFPTLYLDMDVLIGKGNGTMENPYRIVV